MDALRRLTTIAAAVLLVLAIAVGPAVAATGGADGDHRIQLAETPRDQLGLLLLGAMGVGGVLAFRNARRQLKGKRPQATGEFRWR